LKVNRAKVFGLCLSMVEAQDLRARSTQWQKAAGGQGRWHGRLGSPARVPTAKAMLLQVGMECVGPMSLSLLDRQGGPVWEAEFCSTKARSGKAQCFWLKTRPSLVFRDKDPIQTWFWTTLTRLRNVLQHIWNYCHCLVNELRVAAKLIIIYSLGNNSRSTYYRATLTHPLNLEREPFPVTFVRINRWEKSLRKQTSNYMKGTFCFLFREARESVMLLQSYTYLSINTMKCSAFSLFHSLLCQKLQFKLNLPIKSSNETSTSLQVFF
jgi:hypothetical protein